MDTPRKFTEQDTSKKKDRTAPAQMPPGAAYPGSCIAYPGDGTAHPTNVTAWTGSCVAFPESSR